MGMIGMWWNCGVRKCLDRVIKDRTSLGDFYGMKGLASSGDIGLTTRVCNVREVINRFLIGCGMLLIAIVLHNPCCIRRWIGM